MDGDHHRSRGKSGPTRPQVERLAPTRPGPIQPAPERLARYRRGHIAEWIAEALLRGKGYRIMERRYRSPVGEIDLIAQRGRRLAFVEVKHRADLDAAIRSISPQQRKRIEQAAIHWLKRHPRLADHEPCFDLILIAPWTWPQHLRDAFSAFD